MIGPTRPAVIAERYQCPGCGAAPERRCMLAGTDQSAIHEQRHQAARRAMYRYLLAAEPVKVDRQSSIQSTT